jgi:hypothetical protein
MLHKEQQHEHESAMAEEKNTEPALASVARPFIPTTHADS